MNRTQLKEYAQNFFISLGFKKIEDIQIETESFEYFACRLLADDQKFIFRRAKVTEKKSGLFVTLWKRQSQDSEIKPLEFTDDFEKVFVEVKENKHAGVFVFDKEILLKKRILAHQKKDGKRAFRVYPPWSQTNSKQAASSQLWQCKYFRKI